MIGGAKVATVPNKLMLRSSVPVGPEGPLLRGRDAETFPEVFVEGL